MPDRASTSATVFEVVATLGDRLVFEQRLERTQNEVRVELCRRGRARQQVVSRRPRLDGRSGCIAPAGPAVDTAMPTMVERIAVG